MTTTPIEGLAAAFGFPDTARLTGEEARTILFAQGAPARAQASTRTVREVAAQRRPEGIEADFDLMRDVAQATLAAEVAWHEAMIATARADAQSILAVIEQARNRHGEQR